jgi:tetratricopeptide (TPR) repeat protein
VATSLNNLAVLYVKLGEYAKAEPLCQRALAIDEKVFGSEHPDVATNLNNLAELYRKMGAYAQAESLLQRALAIREKTLGPEHLEVATSLNSLAVLYTDRGEYAKAEPLYQRALAIEEEALGPEHPEVATTLNNLAGLYDSLGEYKKAEPLYQQALAIREKALGSEHLEVATSLNNLAGLYDSLGEYKKAEPLYQQALAIREKALGPEHPDVATSLNNLAEFYRSRGEYVKAEPLHLQALAIREKVMGTEHPTVARSLNNLAELYKDMGAYAKAEPLLQRAIVILEKALGPEHPHVTFSLNNLAALYYLRGEYAKAEPLYQRSLVIREQTLGPEHPDVATSLNNLALLYDALGAYANAEPLYQRALAIREKAMGPEHPDVANSLNNLALLYNNRGEYAKAEPLYQRALAIREKALGPDHPDTATSLNNLAVLYVKLGEYAKAEPLLQRALTIREKTLGPEHSDVASSLNNLAALYDDLSRYDKAEPLYQRATAMWKKVLGPEHPNVAQSLNNLAILYAALDNVEYAHNLHKQAQQIDEKLIDQVMGFTSEKQKLAFLATRRGNLEMSLTLVSQHLAQNVSARKDALDIWLRRKGVILEAQKRFQEALIYSDNPEAVKTFQDLSMVRAQLSKLVFSGPGKAGLKVYKQQIAELEQQKEQLEAKLSRLSQAYAVSQQIAKADVAKVAQALPANTVLVDFARVGMFNFKAKGQENKWNPAHYLAFVLHAGNGDNVDMLDLGAADPIDQAVMVFKKQVSRVSPRDPEGLKAIEASKQVYQLVFAALQAALGDVKELFISPDGNLNLIPFEVLVGPDGKFLIEEYTFNYLAAGRDILGFGAIKEQGSTPVLMGDPDFDLEPTPGLSLQGKGTEPTPNPSQEGKPTPIPSPNRGGAGGEVGFNRSAALEGWYFKRLSGTKAEIEAIDKLLQRDHPALYTDAQATEAVLLNASAPRILHLATHGFFLEDQELPRDDLRRGVEWYDLSGSGLDGLAKFQPVHPELTRFENPLLRSGIVLAGVNPAIKAGRSDGVVTAEKILSLRLQGTEVVVLSACETGLGNVQVGEGVYGLRRAFMQAGAKSLVMSLWAVPDKETKELMVQFYQNLLSGKLNRVQALRQAVLHEMQVVKERYGSPHPLYWGAFVLFGDGR